LRQQGGGGGVRGSGYARDAQRGGAQHRGARLVYMTNGRSAPRSTAVYMRAPRPSCGRYPVVQVTHSPHVTVHRSPLGAGDVAFAHLHVRHVPPHKRHPEAGHGLVRGWTNAHRQGTPGRVSRLSTERVRRVCENTTSDECVAECTARMCQCGGAACTCQRPLERSARQSGLGFACATTQRAEAAPF
jgi:hypothetical protein